MISAHLLHIVSTVHCEINLYLESLLTMPISHFAEYSEGVYILEKAFKRAYGRYMPKERESSDDEFSMSKDSDKTQKAASARKPGSKGKKLDEVNTIELNNFVGKGGEGRELTVEIFIYDCDVHHRGIFFCLLISLGQ